MIQLQSSSEEIQEPGPIEPVTSKVLPWLARLLYPVGRFIVLPFYFGKIEVTGQENLPKEGPVILAPSHRARWDPILVTFATGKHVTGRDLRYMTSASEVKGVQGWFIRRLGGFPIDTKRPGIGSLRHGVELILERQMLVIFPEGGIFRDGKVHSLKPGLARIAIQAESMQPNLGVKIVPIVVRYNPIIPTWGCHVKIEIASAIEVADYCLDRPKESAAKLTTDLEAVLNAIDRKDV